ncbi:MAG: hypothetical protein A2W00_15030 [Candidatus Eisenbacteria bacterium RBG_16_71_46]|nr:MAG: hypothetical protein A2W00_15030 [Candidatus Eisenbacteria bacterium RBG_16_71_46]
MKHAFIGIDLAWSPRHGSGLAVLRPGRAGLSVAALETRVEVGEIVAFVREHALASTVVMVDAPLVVPNRTGMRDCDRETHRRFGARQAGAYPVNRVLLARYNRGRPRGEELAEALVSCGFEAEPDALPAPPLHKGRWLFECYPHPAQVVLFRLARTLKYKRKRQGRARASAEFRRFLGLVGGLRGPAIALTPGVLRTVDATRAVGREYKRREDMLDALFCAYLAALVPAGRLEMLGTPRTGSIVVPRQRRLGPGDRPPPRAPAVPSVGR